MHPTQSEDKKAQPITVDKYKQSISTNTDWKTENAIWFYDHVYIV